MAVLVSLAFPALPQMFYFVCAVSFFISFFLDLGRDSLLFFWLLVLGLLVVYHPIEILSGEADWVSLHTPGSPIPPLTKGHTPAYISK